MAKLVWDAEGKKYYETGVDRGVLYKPTTGTAYDSGFAWNGLTGVTETPSGADATDSYADNIKYATIRAAEKFGGTIEAYTYPDEFMECDGSAEPTPGVTIGQQTRKTFGLSYRTMINNDLGQEDYKLHLVYGATASPSQRSYSTINESPEAMTMSWEFSTTPINVTGYKPTALLVVDSREVEAENLAELEAVLYGTESDEPKLPTPDEVISMLKVSVESLNNVG